LGICCPVADVNNDKPFFSRPERYPVTVDTRTRGMELADVLYRTPLAPLYCGE
jgi:hypothetical protein